MKGLRLTELYPSIQGEGPNVGEPTVFVRFGGCNLRCPLWPCDTPHAIFPEQWRDDPVVKVEDLLKQIADMPGMNICITGGEPFMQPEVYLAALVGLLRDMQYTIDVFTNGSLKPFPSWVHDRAVTIILDWKLSGSGEASSGLEVRLNNFKELERKDAVKFTIATEDDFQEALALWNDMKGRTVASFYAGCVWGLYEEHTLVERILEFNLPWKLNVQVHKYVWPGVEKGI